jgi:Ca2+-binding RTX toxin-like protein
MATFVANQPFDAIAASTSLYPIFNTNFVDSFATFEANVVGPDGVFYPDSYTTVGSTEAGQLSLVLRGDFGTAEDGFSLAGIATYLSVESEQGILYYFSGISLNVDDFATLLYELPSPQVHPTLLQLLSGDDEIFLSSGDDLFDAGSGADTVSGGDGCDTLLGSAGDDAIHTGGNDGEGGDTVYDHAYGGVGDDLIYAHSGRELISGHDQTVEDGSGRDTVSFEETDSGVSVSLAQVGIQAVRAGHIVELVSIENLFGSNFNDVLTGSASSNVLFGGEGDDTLNGGGGEDLINGGEGTDTAQYDAERAAFTVTQAEGGYNVTAIANQLDVDALASIEKIQFDDGALVFDIDSGNVSFAYRIYAAAYGRTPDEAGLRFWTDQLDNRGDGPPTNADKEFIAGFFLTADEYISKYGENPTNEEFINKLYENVLHREADQAGYDFWLGVLAGGQGKDDLLIWFTDSDENLANTAPDLDNGVWVL